MPTFPRIDTWSPSIPFPSFSLSFGSLPTAEASGLAGLNTYRLAKVLAEKEDCRVAGCGLWDLYKDSVSFSWSTDSRMKKKKQFLHEDMKKYLRFMDEPRALEASKVIDR